MDAFVRARWFPFVTLTLTVIACLLWFVGAGQWTWQPLLLPALPAGVRLLAGRSPLRRTPVDGLLLLFLLTAGAAVFNAYDRELAVAKFFILLGAVLLFYAVAALPRRDLWLLLVAICVLPVVVAATFLLTNDWQVLPADVGLIQRWGVWWMGQRPSLSLPVLHPNAAGGIIAMLLPFHLALARRGLRAGRPAFLLLAVGTGALSLVGLFLTSSRAAWFALAAAVSVGLLWWLSHALGARWGRSGRFIFGSVMALPAAGLAALPLLSPLLLSHTTASRLDLIRAALHLIGDYPFLGAGLASFGGLYSQYIVMLPSFFYSYGHFFWLDVILEQGIVGLGAWLGVYAIAGWLLLRSRDDSTVAHSLDPVRWAVAVAALALFIHTWFDDPLYAYTGTPLLFLLPGLSVAVAAPGGDAAPLRLRALLRPLPAAIALAVVGSVVATAVVYRQPLRANWLAERGAVRMAQVELAQWPTDEWDGEPYEDALSPTAALFRRALVYDPHNRTAHHRLGLIALRQQRFATAVDHLAQAHARDPDHGGIAKALGYSYVWHGDFAVAAPLLASLPDAAYELSNYKYWWLKYGRDDLSQRAVEMGAFLNAYAADVSGAEQAP